MALITFFLDLSISGFWVEGSQCKTLLPCPAVGSVMVGAFSGSRSQKSSVSLAIQWLTQPGKETTTHHMTPHYTAVTRGFSNRFFETLELRQLMCDWDGWMIYVAKTSCCQVACKLSDFIEAATLNTFIWGWVSQACNFTKQATGI